MHASYRQVVDEHAKEWERVNYEMMMDRAGEEQWQSTSGALV